MCEWFGKGCRYQLGSFGKKAIDYPAEEEPSSLICSNSANKMSGRDSCNKDSCPVSRIFTDGEIEIVLEKAEKAWKHLENPDRYLDEFILTLRTYLSKGGMLENVCSKCLGSGRNDQETD